jgi:ferrous iron transport protein A
LTLRDCPPGRDVRLREVAVVGPDRRRLFEWGFLPGTPLRVVARSLAGGLIVAVGDARVALDARLAGSLYVDGVR